jgi:perosamine synthetase
MQELSIRGIETRSFFIPMHRQPVFERGKKNSRHYGPYPVAEAISEQGFYLPSGLTISQDQIRYICQQIEDIYQSQREQAE